METPELLERLHSMKKTWDTDEENFPPVIELDALINELEREHYLLEPLEKLGFSIPKGAKILAVR